MRHFQDGTWIIFLNHFGSKMLVSNLLALSFGTFRQWDICLFLTCGSADWDQWDMQDLINETNTNHPDRITPTMESALLELGRQLPMHYLIWGAIQRTLF